jgi:hypothetical protein
MKVVFTGVALQSTKDVTVGTFKSYTFQGTAAMVLVFAVVALSTAGPPDCCCLRMVLFCSRTLLFKFQNDPENRRNYVFVVHHRAFVFIHLVCCFDSSLLPTILISPNIHCSQNKANIIQNSSRAIFFPSR